jgi:hypothetical protein
MPIIARPLGTPFLTVFQKTTGGVSRYWFYANFRAVEMTERLALRDFKRGKIILKTVADA